MNSDDIVVLLEVLLGALAVLVGLFGARRWLKSRISQHYDKLRRLVFTQFLTDQKWQIMNRANRRIRWWEKNTNIKENELWDKRFEGKSGNVYLNPLIAAEGKLGSQPVALVYGLALDNSDEEAVEMYVTFWKAILPGAVNGWARLRAAKSEYKGSLRQADLESVDFNREVDVHAHPKKLAFQLFAPDLMDQYLHDKLRPWVHVEGNQILIVYEHLGPEMQLEYQSEQVARILKSLRGSGAFEKIP